MNECELCTARERIAELELEIEAMKAIMSPPAIPPVAVQPERVVTGIELPDERE